MNEYQISKTREHRGSQRERAKKKRRKYTGNYELEQTEKKVKESNPYRQNKSGKCLKHLHFQLIMQISTLKHWGVNVHVCFIHIFL